MSHSRCTLYIDLKTIKDNYSTLRKLTNSEVAACIKANAYGLGASQVAPVLEEAGCKNFFVSFCHEGVELRKTIGPKANIYSLHGVFSSELEEFREYKLTPVLNHLYQIEIWQNYALLLGKMLPCIIHVNTGMHRLGLPLNEIQSLNLDRDASRLNVLYVMSHLTSAESVDSPTNQEQLEKFKLYSIKFKGIKQTLANSGGIFLGKDYHFDLVRPGAALYGINPAPYLKNPIKLFAPIIQLHDLPSGSSLGYNNTYTNTRNKSCLIATLPIGYADGISRALSNKGEVFIDGVSAPIIGRVSMDLITIDVSHVNPDKVFLGQEVEIIGDNCPPETLAQLLNTNSYEILTMLGDRYERRYSK
ncbi:MAG: alanine racemase [Rickettsiaceae bacterium]|nr:alanine racemase [Rickettsiaceae bacterium]